MSDVRLGPTDGDGKSATSDRLDSWKEIAAYLKRDVTTVQRWEKKEGLPVHRQVHDKLGSVYAYTAELEGWRKRHEAHEPSAPDVVRDRPSRSFNMAVLAAAAFLLAIAGWLAITPERSEPAAPPALRSLAVLPLRNLTGDASQEWLSDGMTEALSSTFARLGSLTVVSSTSTLRYKGSERSAHDIGRELGGVDALVEGSVSRSGSRVRVTLSVVHAATDRRLWSGTYERELPDVLSLYSDVALAAAREMSVVVTTDERDHLQVVHTPASAAYEEYLRGLYLRYRSHEGGCIDAEPVLLRASQADALFAAPLAVLASCYVFPDRVARPAADAFARARAAAEKAIKIDPRLGLAHLAQGYIYMRQDFDQQAAEQSFRRAVEVEPGVSQAYIALGEFLAITGRIEEGIASARRGLRLNPFVMDHHVAVGHLLLRVGRVDEAIAQLEATLALDGNYNSAWLWLAEARAAAGEQAAAVNAYLRWFQLIAQPTRAQSARAELESTFKHDGWKAFWERELVLAEEEARHPGSVYQLRHHRYAGPVFLARRAVRVGRWSDALDLLDVGIAEFHYHMPFIVCDPHFAPLRPEPRFQALVKRMGFPARAL
jgi:TolB-like protein